MAHYVIDTPLTGTLSTPRSRVNRTPGLQCQSPAHCSMFMACVVARSIRLSPLNRWFNARFEAEVAANLPERLKRQSPEHC